MAITPIRPTLGSNHARGRSHAAYQGRSTGASSVNNSSPQAQTAPWTSNHLPAARPPPRLTSQVVATRTTRVARRRNTTAKAAQVRRFIYYALTQGQQFAPRLLYGKIPVPVLVAAEKTLKKIHT